MSIIEIDVTGQAKRAGLQEREVVEALLYVTTNHALVAVEKFDIKTVARCLARVSEVLEQMKRLSAYDPERAAKNATAIQTNAEDDVSRFWSSTQLCECSSCVEMRAEIRSVVTKHAEGSLLAALKRIIGGANG